tara:strand:- start:701 stop:1585 length:885 start_codon:yes stop_codon:yes gene_type:complete
MLKQHLHTVDNTLNTPQRILFENATEEMTEEEMTEITDNTISNVVGGFFDNYFDGELNENTDNDDIIKAVVELNLTRDAVNSYFVESTDAEIRFDEAIVMNFIKSYFGDNLSEDTSDDDVNKSIDELNYTCESVNEFLDIDEGFWSKVGKGAALGLGGYAAWKGRKHIGKGIRFAASKLKKYGGKAVRAGVKAGSEKTSEVATKVAQKAKDIGGNIANKVKDVGNSTKKTGPTRTGSGTSNSVNVSPRTGNLTKKVVNTAKPVAKASAKAVKAVAKPVAKPVPPTVYNTFVPKK